MQRLVTSPLLFVAALAALVALSSRAQAQDKAPELSLTAAKVCRLPPRGSQPRHRARARAPRSSSTRKNSMHASGSWRRARSGSARR